MPNIGHKRLAEIGRKLLALSGADVATETSELLQLVQQLEPPGPEHYFLGGSILVAAGLEQIGVAGERSWVRLRNPVDTGMLLIVEYVLVAFQTASRADFRLDNTDTPLVSVNGNVGIRDRRWTGATTPAVTGFVERGTEIAITGSGPVLLVDGPGGLKTEIVPVHFVIDEGRNLSVSCNNLATTIAVSYVWRERFAERYERRRP